MVINSLKDSTFYVVAVLILIWAFFPSSSSNGADKVFSFDRVANEGYVAFIVNEYDKNENSDNDEDDVQECDGSGWITHGDGHRTKCDGCKNCKRNESSTTNEVNLFPEIITPPPRIVKKVDNKQILYFGADWCDHCKRFKNNEIPKLQKMGITVHKEEGADVKIVDASSNMNELIANNSKLTKYVPEFVKMVNGEVKENKTGFMTAQELKDWMNEDREIETVVVEQNRPIRQVLFFTANWCGPCQTFKSVEIPKIKNGGLIVSEKNNADIRIIDVDNPKNNKIMLKYKKSRVVPEFVLTRNGHYMRHMTGLQSASTIVSWLNNG